MDEVKSIQRELEALSADDKIGDPARVQRLLEKLGKINITIDILRVTKVGKTVSKVRRSAKDQEGVERLAKGLIAAWKAVANDDRPQSSQEKRKEDDREKEKRDKTAEPPSKKQKASPSPVPKDKPALSRSTSTSSMASQASSKPATPARKHSDVHVEFRMTDSAVRNNCRKLLAQALHGDGTDLMGSNPGRLAEKIEEELYRQHGQDDRSSKYKAAVLSRRANLADPKNDLRNQVLTGAISPERLCSMSAQDMASREILEKIAEAHKANLHEAQVGGGTTTTTDMFKCGKCKKNNCSYFQMQTRSADEPMTTFVTCNVCGNKWKFC
eukprot:comp23619_c0_seq1/m.40213 comp23619_c0_seq1/g.40213  ORF comp23619_c0_seq1/g.40213 comp23619_c0_seq1/m.40213 type:complete len:327 (-) comp23619_c0_seq1:304-1284(-)